MADQITTTIFGNPNPGMASSSHASLHHTTMPSFFDSSMYTGPGLHWATPHDYARWMINRRHDLKLLHTPIFLFLMIVDKGGEELGLKLYEVSLKVQGVQKNF
jgi:hypothetical protein